MDFKESTALRNLLGDSGAAYNYWVTLHDATGGFLAGDVYVAGVRGELPTGNGYIQGEKAVALTNTNGVLDGPDVSWTATGGDTLSGSIGPASYAALWVSTGTIAGAGLVSVKDMSPNPQTASIGNGINYSIEDPITVLTPA